MKDFEIVPHTADLKIRVYGLDKKILFKNALIGMFQSVRPRIEGATMKNDRVVCALSVQREICIKAEDDEGLLIDFLSEALYLSDVYNEAYLDVDIHELNDISIHATLKGAPVQGFEVVEIKAVTYHDLEIKQIDGVWQADIVFDI